MATMAVPLSAGKHAAWEEWIAELNGPRKGEFDDMNARLGLTEHSAHLQPTPDGNYLVIARHEGAGGDSFLSNMMASDNEFDQWFLGRVADLHELDPAAEPPAPAVRKL